MSRKIASFIDIVRLEDKETKLKSFVRTVVEQSAMRCESDLSTQAILLIARSVESPVVKAVTSLVREGAIAAPVKVILALAPRQDGVGEAIDDGLAGMIATHGGRIVRDIRLFDAHEQLVLGASSSWIGDCMRRDPMKRDAYECYAADCSKTAGWARTSFERMWDHCESFPEELLSPAKPADEAACLPPVNGEEAATDPRLTSTG
jgi:hypothetical protein